MRVHSRLSARAVFALVLLGLPGCGSLADDLFCSDHDCEFTKAEWRRVESLANLGDPALDGSNKYLKNPAAIQLGQYLYYDRDLSGVASWVDVLGTTTPSHRAEKGAPLKISCATCHDPAHGGGDITSRPGNVSIGAGSYDVNGQQTLNAAHYPLLYWNGRADSLWSQAAQVMESVVSMNGNRVAIVRTAATKYKGAYEAIFRDAAGTPELLPDLTAVPDGKPGDPGFDGLPDADRAAINRAYSNLAKAIGAYEWELTSRDADFDRYVNGSRELLSPAAVRGLKLFVGRASCIDCHRTPLLSDGAFHNIGVPQRGPGVPTVAECPSGSAKCDCVTGKVAPGQTCLPWGAFSGLFKLANATGSNLALRRDGEFSDLDAASKAQVTASFTALAIPSAATVGAWRTPSLRDVAITAPYMHDGVYATLDEVIGHYNVGGTAEGGGRKAVELSPLLLSAQDRTDLAEFLRTLTGRPTTPALHAPPPGVQ